MFHIGQPGEHACDPEPYGTADLNGGQPKSPQGVNRVAFDLKEFHQLGNRHQVFVIHSAASRNWFSCVTRVSIVIAAVGMKSQKRILMKCVLMPVSEENQRWLKKYLRIPVKPVDHLYEVHVRFIFNLKMA